MSQMITRGRGGNRHPLSVRQFILDHLARVGEDFPASMHRAYNAELIEIARDKGRTAPYRKPSYQSFYMQVWKLAKAGSIKLSGREEESDSPQFAEWDQRPMRRYYRLA